MNKNNITRNIVASTFGQHEDVDIKVLAVIFLMMLFFLFLGCVREEKPGRVMSCVWYFAGSEAHWQNHKRMTSMATAIFSYTAVYFCFCSFPFPFPYHFRRKALILYSVGATHY